MPRAHLVMNDFLYRVVRVRHFLILLQKKSRNLCRGARHELGKILNVESFSLEYRQSSVSPLEMSVQGGAPGAGSNEIGSWQLHQCNILSMDELTEPFGLFLTSRPNGVNARFASLKCCRVQRNEMNRHSVEKLKT